MARERILLVTYDFPPGLAGVRRVVKFARFLPEFGYDPMVLAAQPDEGLPPDHEALAAVEAQGYPVHRTPSLDPYQARRVVRSAAGSLRSAAYRLRSLAEQDAVVPAGPEAGRPAAPGRAPSAAGRWLAQAGRGLWRWLPVPDDRIGWVPFACAAGWRILRSQPVRYVLTSSFPNSAHLVGRHLKRRFRIRWVADFRDGWTQNPYFARYPTALHRALDGRLERSVLREADAIVTVSEPIADHLRRAGGGDRVHVIPNGFDPDDFAGIEPERYDRFTIGYTGTLFMQRSPEVFFTALRALLDDHPGMADNLQVVFRTRFQPEHLKAIDRHNLGGVVRNLGMGTHREALRLQMSADALLVLEGDAPNSEIMLTQKIFEYLAAGKPILAVTPRGALADLVRRTGAGVVVAPDQVFAIKERLFELFHGQLRHHPDACLIARFHRREQAGDLAAILDAIR